MNADTYFEMGRTHLVCQDYAQAAQPDPDLGWLCNRPFVVVSDGCSSSHNTDFGSRLLCLSTAREMGEFGVDDPVELEGKNIIAGAVQMANYIGMHLTALDATVLVAWVEGPNIRVLVWGDGVVSGRYRQGGSRMHVIEFAYNAPAYLSYTWDESRQVVYRQETVNGLHTVYTTDQGDEDPVAKPEHREGLDPVEFTFPIADFDLVVLLSDGIQTCHIPVDEAVENVLAIKNYDGRFITRRVRRFLKQHRALGNDVDDDLAVGALYCPDPATGLEES